MRGLWIILVLIVIVVIGGFLLLGNNEDKDVGELNIIPEQPEQQPTITPTPEPVEEESNIKEFTITAKKWDFEPSAIRVNEGDTVKLTIKSIDVDHGFRLSAFDVSEKLVPGEEVDVEFVADKKGTFRFFCNVFCGAGHSHMEGSLIVK
tara:strand:- start:499 stop:945 length:447 start_codon:yes stop_codon:yes gene_type:complete